MAKSAKSSELRTAFEHHLKETEGHVQQLQQIFEMLGISPKTKTCEGMKGILDEGARMLDDSKEGDLRDVAMISAAQRMEHYEMAAYGTVRTYAERLGKTQAVQLLDKTLQEEKAADKKLTEISHQAYQHAQRAA